MSSSNSKPLIGLFDGPKDADFYLTPSAGSDAKALLEATQTFVGSSLKVALDPSCRTKRDGATPVDVPPELVGLRDRVPNGETTDLSKRVGALFGAVGNTEKKKPLSPR